MLVPPLVRWKHTKSYRFRCSGKTFNLRAVSCFLSAYFIDGKSTHSQLYQFTQNATFTWAILYAKPLCAAFGLSAYQLRTWSMILSCFKNLHPTTCNIAPDMQPRQLQRVLMVNALLWHHFLRAIQIYLLCMLHSLQPTTQVSFIFTLPYHSLSDMQAKLCRWGWRSREVITLSQNRPQSITKQ